MVKGHLVNTSTNEWFHYDDRYRLWSCDCVGEKAVSLCLSICDCLKEEGELRDLERQIAQKRKDLGLLQNKD